MANVINATSTGNGGLVSTGDDSGILNIQTNETTAITVDTSQNVLVGTTSATFTYTGSSTATAKQVISTSGYDCLNLISTAANPGIDFSQPNSASTIYRYANITGVMTTTTAGSESGALTFATGNAGANSAERMRITSTGQLLLGATSSNAQFYLNGNSAPTFGSYITANISGGATTAINAQSPCSTHIQFYNSSTGSGSITVNGGAVSYNTSSDYRLKENIAPMTGALAKVAQLKPVTYKWKLDGAYGQGFIAHELQEIVPNSVTGAKDAVDADGNPKYQGIDTSYLVATLTAAIQELKALVDAQAAEIAELKAKVNV